MAAEEIDRLLAELAAWSGEQRVDEAALGRARVRSLRSQLEESATLVGTLVDLTEAETHLTVQTSRGRVHRGVAAAVGADFVAVRTDAEQLVMIALSAVVAVRPTGPALAATGSRGTAPTTLAQLLGELADERPRVRLVAAGEPVSGELLAVGADVLSIRCDTQPPTMAYVPVTSVSEVSLG